MVYLPIVNLSDFVLEVYQQINHSQSCFNYYLKNFHKFFFCFGGSFTFNKPLLEAYCCKLRNVHGCDQYAI